MQRKINHQPPKPAPCRGLWGRSGAYAFWQRQRQQAFVEQAKALLEQLVAALRLTQAGEQARQFGASLGVALHAQAASEVIARLAPQTVLQAKAAKGEQQAGILRVVFEPAFGGLQLACLLYTSSSPRDRTRSRMPSSA